VLAHQYDVGSKASLMQYTLREIADEIDVELHGDPECRITNVATLQNAGENDLSFLANRRYYKFLNSTNASAVILAEKDRNECPTSYLIAADPYLCFVKAVRFLNPDKKFSPGVSDSAVVGIDTTISPSSFIGSNVVIGDNVIVGDSVYVGPGCVIGDRVVVGDSTRLTANVTLCSSVKLGQRVLLHPGVVIGSDGFGIARDEDRWLKAPQLGSVVIFDDVEIGANTTVDRGAIEDTVIEAGAKIDNQVQIGHNARIGEHTAVAGCVAIAGSVTIGKRCAIGGLSALAGHIEIADDVTVTGMSGVSNSIKNAGVYSSAPIITDNMTWRKNVVRFNKLDDFVRRMLKLEAELKK